MPQAGPFRLVAFTVILVVVVVAASWLGWCREVAQAIEPALSSPPGAATATPNGLLATEADPVRAAASTSVRENPMLLVRGRCLAAETGLPLQVALHVGDDDDGAPEGDSGAIGIEALATGASASDGRFELNLAFAGQKNLRLLATAPDRAPMGCRREGAQAGEVWDIGDVRMTLTARVAGELVDATGAPVADAQVMLLMLAPEPTLMAFRNLHTAPTDARGRFVMISPMAAGEWLVSVDGTGALRTPRKTQVPAGGEHFVRIEVERPDPKQAITGTVKGRTGLPLADVALSAYGEGARSRGRSGADGAFLLHRGPPHFDRGKPGVELSAQAPQLEHLRPSAGQWVAWGQHDVVVVMQPLASVTVRAIDERGERVHAFEVLHGQLSSVGSWMDYMVSKKKPVEGGVQLTELHGGEHLLLLRPQDGSLAVAGPVHFVVGDTSPNELTVRVPDRIDLQVDVVDTAGSPVPHCELDLIASFTEAPVDMALPAPRLPGLRSSGLREARQVALASGTTDDRGIAKFAAPPGRLSLHARCVTHLPHTSDVVVAASEPHLRIVLEAAAVLHGRLVPIDLLPALGLGETKPERRLAVVARAVAAGVPPARARAEIARADVAVDGTFTLGPLPPGVMALRLSGWLDCNDVHSASMQHALGDLDTAGARVLEREFAVAAFVPATATGIVLLDGQPMVDAQFFLRRLEPEPRISVRVATGKDGRFRTRVPPGVLGPQLAIPSQPGPGHDILPLLEQWTIGPGETGELRIEGKVRRLRLVLRDADDKPLGNRRMRVESKDYSRLGALATDTAGVVEITPAPYGEFTVHVQNDPGAELASKPLQIPAGDPASLEVRVGG